MDLLSPPDEYEAGKDVEAARHWARLVELQPGWSDEHVRLVNFLRRLYRNCLPRIPDGTFVPGGSFVFDGAHIRIPGDYGEVYTELLSTGGLHPRTRSGPLHGSSHASLFQQLEVEIPEAGSLLVGCGVYLGCGVGQHTWLQVEAHPAAGRFTDWVLHGLDYFRHLVHHKRQVGPFGYSPYSEKPPRTDPLIARSVTRYL